MFTNLGMQPFLSSLGHFLQANFTPEQLQNVTVVFPNRRAGLFFQQTLAKQLNQPIWAPKTLTLQEFVHSHSKLQAADTLLLVFKLYTAYKAFNSTEESFDKFFFWGELLLQDFEQVDHYLVDASMLFTNIEQLKALDKPLDFLEPEQLAIIQDFWKNFKPESSTQQQDFVALWQVLGKVYRKFKQELSNEGIAYSGMIFKEVSQTCLEGQLEHNGKPIVFAGFNNLSLAEETIIGYFVKEHNALTFWKADTYYVNNPQQEAGLFIRRHLNNKYFGEQVKACLTNNLGKNPPKISITNTALEVGQTKVLNKQLSECLSEAEQFDLERTAIVLPDEHLLFPLLHALPKSYCNNQQQTLPINSVNVTMGYPLRSTSLYSLVELLVNLQESFKPEANSIKIHFNAVLAILRHPYIYYYNQEAACTTIHEIERRNRVWLSSKELEEKEALYKQIFRPVQGIPNLFDYLLQVLEKINESLTEENFDQPAIEQEYILQFFSHLKRLRELVQQEKLDLQLPVFLKLLRQIIQGQKLPFSGEPLGGLQIMGVLETRTLDFDNLFILSMNEGSFPPSANQSSFIPYNLRKGYGLPTFDTADAEYAYYFYSMIEQAKHVHLFYNSASSNGQKGEASRLIYQLLYESGFPIYRQTLTHTIGLQSAQPITIKKNAAIMQVLGSYLVGSADSRRFTPSAFNIYLDCRLKFYFKYIANLQEADEVQEHIDAATFGNMVHDTLEQVYKGYIKQKGSNLVEEADFNSLTKKLDTAVSFAYAKHFGVATEEAKPSGRNLLVQNIVSKMSKAVLRWDETYAPFNIIALESQNMPGIANAQAKYQLDLPILINGEYQHIGLKGIIDRIDEKEGLVRILDYKTGRDDNAFASVESLFDRESKKRNKAAMQTILYAMLYIQAFPDTDKRIVPGLVNSKELFGTNYSPQLQIGEYRNKRAIADVREIADEFMGYLTDLVQEITDPEVDFDQTDNVEKCSYCPYIGICHK